MGSPVIWGGNGALNLQAGGLNLTSGQQLRNDGPKNYLANPLAETGTTTGWSLGNVSLTSAFPTGTPTFGSGASGNLTLAATSTTPLSGTYSFSYASSAATTAGNFIASDAFTVDTADLGKPLTVQFYYQATSNGSNGNWSGTSSNSFGVALYDVTLGTTNWIMPAGVWGMTQNSGAGICTATFQTSVTSGQQYRLVVFNANASSGAITLYFDQFFVGPQVRPIGAVEVDWASYDPSPSAGWGSVTTKAGFFRRSGDSIFINAYWTNGTTAGSIASINLPPGMSIDTTKLTRGNTTAAAGQIVGVRNDNNTANVGYAVTATATDATKIYFGANFSATDTSVPKNGSAISTSSQAVSVQIGPIPIAGLSSNVQLSNDTDTRVVAMRANNASATLTGSFSDITWGTIVSDSHAGMGAISYTILVTGYYDITSQVSLGGTQALNGTAAISINKNGSLIQENDTGYGGTVTATNTISISLDAVLCNAGDTLKIQVKSSATLPVIADGTNGCYFCVARRSGPSVIAAADTVASSYWVSANFAASTTTPINFDSKEYDYTNSVTPSATVWKFVAPVTGLYLVTGLLGANTTSVNVQIYKNGSAYKNIGNADPAAGSSEAITGTVRLLAGDYIDIRPLTSITVTGGALLATAGVSNIAITKVGN